MQLFVPLVVTLLVGLHPFACEPALAEDRIADAAERLAAAVRARDLSKERLVRGEIKGYGAQALPYLLRYQADDDAFVRSEAVALIGEIPGADAERALGAFLKDSDDGVARGAVNLLFRSRRCPEIVSAGGELKHELVSYLDRAPLSGAAILLLGCFGDDPSVSRMLQEWPKKHAGYVALEPWNRRGDVTVAVEFALAQSANNDANARAINELRTASVDNLVFMISAVKIMTNREILLTSIDLLHDRRDAVKVTTHSRNFLRVCDLAADSLITALDLKLPLSGEERQFTDDALREVEARARAQLNSTGNATTF